MLPDGELPYDLHKYPQLIKWPSWPVNFSRSAFARSITVPPVGLTFGDYLRALITADHDLVPDDPWDYRGALIQAFRRRKIYPRDVASLSEDALLWSAPRKPLAPMRRTEFRELALSRRSGFRGEPRRVPSPSVRARAIMFRVPST